MKQSVKTFIKIKSGFSQKKNYCNFAFHFHNRLAALQVAEIDVKTIFN